MKIKDIVNRDIVNLTNCEQEPIHIPGSIQPHGFLLGLNEQSFIIEYSSGNIAEYTDISHASVLGNTFEAAFGEQAATALSNYIANDDMGSSALLRLALAGKDFLCIVHKSSNIYILEAEPVSQDPKKASEVYDQTSQFLSYIFVYYPASQ